MSRDKSQDGEGQIRGIPTATQPSKVALTEKQITDYQHHRKRMLKWCLNLGKNPTEVVGYSEDTVRVRAGHIDRFYRWVWNNASDGYTTQVTEGQADEFLKELAYRDDMSRSTANKYKKALQMLFKWRSHDLGEDHDWDPALSFSTNDTSSQPRDYLSRDERQQLREGVLELGDEIPSYKSVSPEKRQRVKKLLAVRLSKPLNEIGKDDWEEERSWKYPSMIYSAVDAGLRPVEVGRATTEWVDVSNEVLRIPKDESSKNRENWTVALSERTTDYLDRWLTERSSYPKYDDTDALWLTRRGNPYSSSSCNGLLRRVLEHTDIDRDVTWYAIRHSVGTYMSAEAGLGATQQQLRHKSAQTSLKYDHAPPEERRDALDRM
jgi:site-specific recombinase XerD